MKKLLASAFLLAGLLVRAAEDDYILYWQVVQNEIENASLAAVGKRDNSSGTKSYLEVAGASGVSGVELAADGTSSPIGSVIGSSGIDPTSYSFFVELYDDDGASLWTSSYFAYNALMDYISQPSGNIGGGTVPNGGAWQVTAKEEAVPEPSSGLLMLLGLAGLALRRRKQAC